MIDFSKDLEGQTYSIDGIEYTITHVGYVKDTPGGVAKQRIQVFSIDRGIQILSRDTFESHVTRMGAVPEMVPVECTCPEDAESDECTRTEGVTFDDIYAEFCELDSRSDSILTRTVDVLHDELECCGESATRRQIVECSHVEGVDIGEVYGKTALRYSQFLLTGN